MKKKILTIIAALSCIGIAQAETVNFAGTVSTSCSFGGNTPGTLTAYAQGANYYLDAGFSQGTGSTTDISYTGSPTFTITAVSNVSGSNGVPSLTDITTGTFWGITANQTAANAVSANGFTTGSKSFTLSDTATTDTLTVKMRANASSPFPVGTYNAQAIITCQ